MIIYRYISRQLFTTTASVTFVVTLMIYSGKFISYMSYAAQGRIDGSALFAIMVYRLPEFLEVILPLGMFLGILLSYGRLYLDSEMAVMQATGISQWQIAKFTFFPTLCLTIVVATLSLYLTPLGMDVAEELQASAKSKSGLRLLTPGRFQTTADKSKVSYAESTSDNKAVMNNLFMAEDHQDRLVTLVAARGERIVDKATGDEYIELRDGYRYEGQPGDPSYRVYAFERYKAKLDPPSGLIRTEEIRRQRTSELLESASASALAELQWRISVPLLVPIVVLIAIPLSRVNPRQGRYLKMMPAVVGYLIYLFLLMSGKGWLEKGKIPLEAGLWWIHGVFFIAAVLLYWWPDFRRRQLARKGRDAVLVN